MHQGALPLGYFKPRWVGLGLVGLDQAQLVIRPRKVISGLVRLGQASL
jgi:hypothetical protein